MSNIKELIRAEIERLKRQAEESKMEWVNEGYNQNAFAEDCRISSFDKLLSFLDTLPDEPVTDCHDLEEAKEEYIRKDALMEWLEGMMTKEGATEGFVGGYDFALKDVINKLNEL